MNFCEFFVLSNKLHFDLRVAIEIELLLLNTNWNNSYIPRKLLCFFLLKKSFNKSCQKIEIIQTYPFVPQKCFRTLGANFGRRGLYDG